jgi:hypothetical protein
MPGCALLKMECFQVGCCLFLDVIVSDSESEASGKLIEVFLQLFKQYLFNAFLIHVNFYKGEWYKSYLNT